MDLSLVSLNDLFEAIQYLREADSQNNNKGRPVREWYAQDFSATTRASIVSGLRRTGSRVREQLSPQGAQHVLYVVTDPNALDKLVNDYQKLSYNGLGTILFMGATKSTSDSAAPVFLLSNAASNSSVEEFYLANFKDLKVHKFNPNRKIISTDANQASLPPARLQSLIAEDNEICLKVLQLLDDDCGDAIFTRGPGTSKGWFARQIALRLADGGQELVKFTQFYPGYQYEDFVESYVPNESGGFDLVDKTFLHACEATRNNPGSTPVLAIDELS